MSERKTSEIKLRIEPSVKAEWQQLAADEQIGLSELVVKAVTEYGRNLAAPSIAVKSQWGVVTATNPPLTFPLSSVAPKVVPTSGAEGAGMDVDVDCNVFPPEKSDDELIEEERRAERRQFGQLEAQFVDVKKPRKFGAGWKPWDDAA